MNILIIRTSVCGFLLCLFSFFATGVEAQQTSAIALVKNRTREEKGETNKTKPLVTSILPKYYNQQDGISLRDLIDRALQANQDLAATRLNIEKAKARLSQAKLRPNPTLEYEQSSGKIVGNSGDRSFTVGASLPIEIYGRREARINFSNIEIQASEAEIRNRERILTANILNSYVEALSALREIEMLEKVLELDLETTKFVQIRVNEGDAAPLELNLLQAEVERLRSRRQLTEGRLQSALTQMKLLTGMRSDETLQLREQITTAVLPSLPKTRDEAIETALRDRPDILLSRIDEQIATAGLRLIRANSKPDLTAYTRYTQGQQLIGAVNFPQADRSMAFGVAIGIPFFNKNQGAKAEAEISIKQAQLRRDFAEKAVRIEIIAAYQRFDNSSQSVNTLEMAAIPRATENVATFRRVYEIGEIKITDLINEQRRLLDMNRDLTEALTEKYRAQADLNIALGAAGLLPESK